MNPEILTMLFNFNQFVIEKNTESLTHDDSVMQPQPGGNCINWVLGHILATRIVLHRILGIEPPLTVDAAKIYQRGAPPLAATDPHVLPFDDLLSGYAKSQQLVVARIGELGADDLDCPSDNTDVGEGTVGSLAAKLHFHEAYHAGQIGLLRRLSGRAGAIS